MTCKWCRDLGPAFIFYILFLRLGMPSISFVYLFREGIFFFSLKWSLCFVDNILFCYSITITGMCCWKMIGGHEKLLFFIVLGEDVIEK